MPSSIGGFLQKNFSFFLRTFGQSGRNIQTFRKVSRAGDRKSGLA